MATVKMVKVRDLRPGDVVRCDTSEFSDAVVVKVTPPKEENVLPRVDLFRPYAITADFTYGEGRTIPYVGFEQFSLFDVGSDIQLVKPTTIPEVRRA